MDKTDKIIEKINKLKKIKSIVCKDCKKYHPIDKKFFKIMGISDETIDMVICELEKEFRKYHSNHNIEIKEMSSFPIGYSIYTTPLSCPTSIYNPDDYIDLIGYSFDSNYNNKEGNKNV